MQKIQDEFTDLPVSRQRKWALRNRAKTQEMQRRYLKNKSKKKEPK